MSLSTNNVYIFENKFRLKFSNIGDNPASVGNDVVLDCCMLLVARPAKKGDVYKCEVVTGSYRLPHGDTYYRIPNYALPKETILAKTKTLTNQQGSQMSDLELHTYAKTQGNLIIESNTYGGQLGFRKGRELEQAKVLSKAEKRRYKKIFQAEEGPGEDEEVEDEPDE